MRTGTLEKELSRTMAQPRDVPVANLEACQRTAVVVEAKVLVEVRKRVSQIQSFFPKQICILQEAVRKWCQTNRRKTWTRSLTSTWLTQNLDSFNF